jgi:hypothetical protein
MFLLVSTATLVAGCERYRLDQQMEELCRKDGGIKVHEVVKLPPAEREALLAYRKTAWPHEDRYGSEYRYVREHEVLVGKDADPEKGQGQLARWHYAIYRRSDNRLLGEFVAYTRSGGDTFTFGFHPSSNYCPKPSADLAHSIFLEGK